MSYSIDVRNFWIENERCMELFSTNKPRIPVSYWLDDHFLFEAISLPSTLRYYKDYEYRMKVHKDSNDTLEKELGRRFYNEQELRVSPNRFEVIMGSNWELTEGQTPWLESTIQDIDYVKRLIERVRKIDMTQAALPNNFQEELHQYEKITGQKVKLGGTNSRGPATMATSILGTTNTCMFIMDEPEVMEDFFEVLAQKLIEYHLVLMKATGHDTREGYGFADDNCYLFPPTQYKNFCAPFLKKLFEQFAPLPHQKRYQHSDSSMGHLMGTLNEIGVNQVNLGPTIDINEIRKAMPNSIIHGHIPPFVLRNGSAQDIINIVRNDMESVGFDGSLFHCPAGSVAAGTPFENLRVYMWAVQTYCAFPSFSKTGKSV